MVKYTHIEKINRKFHLKYVDLLFSPLKLIQTHQVRYYCLSHDKLRTKPY